MVFSKHSVITGIARYDQRRMDEITDYATMNDEQLLRYCRQIMLTGLDYQGQERLLAASVLIVGVGGLGSPVAMYLASGGVGRLVIVDDDVVELSNLQRQIIHRTDALGQPKVTSAQTTLYQINPEICVETIAHRLNHEQLASTIAGVDLVLDCSDNFETRFALNSACVQAGKPLISGAVIRMEGQITVFDPRQPHSPCYRCLYPNSDEPGLRCSESGVLAPLPGIIGTIQATEAIKLLAGIGEPLTGRLMLLDAMTMEWRTLRLKKDPHCPVCGQITPTESQSCP